MGNNSVPKFIFRLSRFPVYRGSVLGRVYCTSFSRSIAWVCKFVHLLYSGQYTTFQKLDSFSSLGEEVGRHLLKYILQKEPFSVASSFSHKIGNRPGFCVLSQIRTTPQGIYEFQCFTVHFSIIGKHQHMHFTFNNILV